MKSWFQRREKSSAASSSLRALCSAAAIVAAASATMLAQAPSGEVQGRVFDSLDEVIPGVTVALVPLSGPERTTVSSRSGDFKFAGVAPGTYRLIYKMPAFRPLVHQRVVVDSGVRELRAVMYLAPLRGRETVTLTGRLTAPLPRAPADLGDSEIAIFLELAEGNVTLVIDPRSAPGVAAQLIDDVEKHALDDGQVLIDADTLPEPAWRRQWTGWRWRIEESGAGAMTVAMTRRGTGPIVARVVIGADLLAKLSAASPMQPAHMLAASILRRD